MSHCHFEDHKFHKDAFGNESRPPQRPRMLTTARSMTGPSNVILSYHHALYDKLSQISNWLSPWNLQLPKLFAWLQFSSFRFYRTSSKRTLPTLEILCITCFIPRQPLMGLGLLIVHFSRSHSDTPQSVGLLWTSYGSETDNSYNKKHTHTRDRRPCPRRGLNPQS
jgi:hypothetical protein